MSKSVTLKWKPGGGQQDVSTGKLKAGEPVDVNFVTTDDVDHPWAFWVTQPLGSSDMTFEFRDKTQYGPLSISFNGRGNIDPKTTYVGHLSVDNDSPGVNCHLLVQSRPADKKRG